MRHISALVAAILIVSACAAHAQRIEVTVPSAKPLNGHLILVFAKNNESEPRMQLDEQYKSAQGFGVDAADRVSGVHFVELVGHLVSGRGAGRRRVRCAADVERAR